MASQVERIKAMLRAGPVCSYSDLYGAGMPNGRNRIGELRRQGWDIRSTKCHRRHPVRTPQHSMYWVVTWPRMGTSEASEQRRLVRFWGLEDAR